MTPDSELLNRYLQHHDEDAFRILLERYLALVYSVALRRLGNPEAAKDATQKVFIDVAKQASSLSVRDCFGGWLWKHTSYVCARISRAEQSRTNREQRYMNERQAADANPHSSDLQVALLDAVDALKPAEREAVVLRFIEGRSFDEVGRILNCTENAARMRVDRVMDRLRQALSAKGFNTSGAAIITGLGSLLVTIPSGFAEAIILTALKSSLHTWMGGPGLLKTGAAAAFCGLLAVGLFTWSPKTNITQNQRDIEALTFQQPALSVPDGSNKAISLNPDTRTLPVPSPAINDPWLPALAPFPVEKRDALKAILNRRREYASQLEVTQEELQRQRDEERASLQTLLTTSELELYDLQFSPLAYDLRHKAAAIEISEDEFQQLYRLTSDLHQLINVLPGGSPEDQERMDELELRHQSVIKDLLGEERSGLLSMMEDGTFAGLVSLRKKHELPLGRVLEAYAAVNQGIQGAQTALRSTPGNKRAVEIIASNRELTITRLKEILGDLPAAEFLRQTPLWFELPN